MSEIKKNIETCRGEDVLAEVAALPQDPHFGSLVNEALDPLKQQALHQAGYDGYSEVIEQHKPYTFASAIIQMKSNLLLLLRALWQYPFGSGSLRSLSDMWQHYITRLQGSETYGIHSRLSDLADLPSAPLLLADRCVYNPGVPDGISMAQLIGNTFSETFPLVDNTRGWAMKALWLMDILPWLGGQLVLGADSIVIPTDTSKTWLTGTYPQGVTIYAKTITGGSYHERLMNITAAYLDMPEFETTGQCRIGGTIGEINMPKFRRVLGYWAYQDFIDAAGVETIHLPAMDYLNSCYYYDTAMIRCADLKHLIIKNWDGSYGNNGVDVLAKSCPELLDIDLSGCTKHKWHTAVNCPKLEYVKFGTMTEFVKGATGGGNTNVEWDGCVNLIKIEFGEGTACNIDLGTWSPTLDDSNLEQFLQNFRTYIALRLADNGSGLTLTLSQAVYDAIKDESHLFVFDEGTMTIYAYLTNIKHWTVTK